MTMPPVSPSTFSWQDRLQAAFYGNPLYRLWLQTEAPADLNPIPADPWPGDMARGGDIAGGVFAFAGQRFSADPPNWHPAEACLLWRQTAHGFDWLRDLRSVGGDVGRRAARGLMADWLDRNSAWNDVAWAPGVMGMRIASWVSLHDFVLASADDGFRARIFASLAAQLRHLTRVATVRLHAEEMASAARGLILGGLALGEAGAVDSAADLLTRGWPMQLTADGMPLERDPGLILSCLRYFIDMRTALRAAKKDVPPIIDDAILRLVPALRFFRHGDNGLAIFNGSLESTALLTDSALTHANVRGKIVKSLPSAGFERLATGRTVVLMDTGAPPPRSYDTRAHAGTLSFEMSVGRERLIVNCGPAPTGTGPWQEALAGTAAHSTLKLGPADSSEILAKGGLGWRPQKITVNRFEQDGAVMVDAAHDGYVRMTDLTHRRRLFLSVDGEELRGEDALDPKGSAMPAAPYRFAVRFHLHPAVQCSLIQEGGAALLRLASGQGWRFRCSGGTLLVEDSVYFGSGGVQRRTQQLVVMGETGLSPAIVKWSLIREKKG
jgi:uncharacterized heparinase superfamily protein